MVSNEIPRVEQASELPVDGRDVLLATFAWHLAAEQRKALQSQREAERLYEEARLDPLTRLHNRRFLEESYEQLQVRYRHNRRVGEDTITNTASEHTIVLFDLDNFKLVNDTFGHGEGDRILKQVSKTMRRRVRGQDTLVRFGGEEFAILLPDTSEANAKQVAEAIRRLVEADTGETVSAGVAVLDLDKPLEDNIALADQALYHAKDAGRNQTITYSSLMTPE